MDKTIKAFISGLASLLSAILGVLYIPVLLMVLCNLIDYITGLIAAAYRIDGGISSYKSMKGIAKKVCMWLLVVVGAIIDNLLVYATETIGVESPFHFLIACVVAIWIICNELISILENMIDIGITLPPFLMPLVKYIKKQTEDKVHIAEDEDET